MGFVLLIKKPLFGWSDFSKNRKYFAHVSYVFHCGIIHNEPIAVEIPDSTQVTTEVQVGWESGGRQDFEPKRR